jgi:farnesyl diphosphate synthase
MNPDVAFPVWSGERAQRIGGFIEAVLPPTSEPPQDLHGAMHYAVLGGGKRVRALLAYAAGEFVGADPALVDPAAAAVELIHGYSLVHDDLPCMDDDVLRRGQPTCHVAFGEAVALLAGDALQCTAFEVLAEAEAGDVRRQLALLARAAGSRGMAGGQAIDLAAVGTRLQLPELEHMHRLKTGALIQAAVSLGAGCGRTLDPDEVGALDRYAAAVGLAFQIVDDVLDVEGKGEDLGKTAGKDAAAGKPTYPSLFGLDASKRMAQQAADAAVAALADAALESSRLAEIAQWVVARSS